MFTYVKLKNYKSLVDFEVDLTSSKSNPKKMIIIYGENGAGKSNFIDAFFTLFDTIITKMHENALDKFMLERIKSKNNRELEFFLNRLIDNFKSLENIIEASKTIGSKDNMVLEFGFKLNGKNGIYYIETNNESIVKEKLEYVLDKNKTKYFELSANSKDNYINSSLFKSDKYLDEIKDLKDKFWGKHSFLSILLFEQQDKTQEYISKNVNKNIFNVIDYFKSITIDCNLERYNGFINGKINKKDEYKLDYLEIYLDLYFTDLYSDIKSVFFKKNTINDLEIEYNLFLKKSIYGNIIDIDFQLESTGTKKVLNLLCLIFFKDFKDKVILIDEIDSGIHDLLTLEILKGLYETVKSQIIITTHNTTLLESDIKKDSIYVFNIDSDGNKILIPITEYDKEHPNINYRKRYLNGLYGGIPILSDIDFDNIENFEDFLI